MPHDRGIAGRASLYKFGHMDSKGGAGDRPQSKRRDDMAGGWIKLHRSLLSWEWWDDWNTTRVWIWLLLNANHGPEKWHGMTIKTGQMITSYGKISEATGLTMRETRTAISHLKSTKNVTCKTTNRFQLVTIENWEFYQSDSEAATGNASPKRQPNDNLTTTNKKYKKEKNIRNKNTGDNPPISPHGDVDPFFAYAGDDAEMLNALREFERMRKTLKKPMTPRAKELIIKDLDKLSASREDRIAILEQSVKRGWQGVFALKGADGNGNGAGESAGSSEAGDTLRLPGITYL